MQSYARRLLSFPRLSVGKLRFEADGLVGEQAVRAAAIGDDLLAPGQFGQALLELVDRDVDRDAGSNSGGGADSGWQDGRRGRNQEDVIEALGRNRADFQPECSLVLPIFSG